MAITLTKYIYPIKEEIVLSKHLGYSIDNPRNKEEIQFIKDYIHPALIRNYENSAPGYNPMLSASFAISDWRKDIAGKDEYVYNFLKENHETPIEDIICQSWVIIRYNDNGEFDKAMSDKNTLFDIFFTDARDAYWENFQLVLSYFQLLSLLVHNDDNRYIGDSIALLKKPQSIFYPKDHTHAIIESFRNFHNSCGTSSDSRIETWDYFPDIKEKLISVANSTEVLLSEEVIHDKGKNKKQSTKEKILFVGDLLRVIENETHDVNVKLLLLVSIIEFLVTRNPDTNRFNVEDSISKQFVLKASILIYNNDKERKLDELKTNLKRIYSQRSDIAHGNYISGEDRKKMIESFYLLYEYIRAIFNEFIKDKDFVNFLKEG